MCRRSLPRNTCTATLALATPSLAQSAPKNADPLNAIATPSSAQSVTTQSADAKKKKKPAPTPGPDHSAAATSAPPATSNEAARQAQNPLTPLYSIINENDTNPGVGPLRRTQNVFLIEPVIPVRLTPDFNLVTRWITPVIRQPALASTIGLEFGLGNLQPQFFFTPAHQGDGFVWSVGPNFWLPTDKTLGINKWGGEPTAVALWVEGPLNAGVLASNTWAGTHGSSLTGDRVNQLFVEPFFFYNVFAGWYFCSIPYITADWTAPDHKWTVPVGGGVGRVVPVGDMLVNTRFEAYYNGLFGHALGSRTPATGPRASRCTSFSPRPQLQLCFDEVLGRKSFRDVDGSVGCARLKESIPVAEERD